MLTHDIFIPNYIITKFYSTNNKLSSLSFILNLKNEVEYALKGEIALLWNIIVETQNYELIHKYSEINNLENIVDYFLYELKINNIIKTDLEFTRGNFNYLKYSITPNSNNYGYYIASKYKFLQKNNFIDILELVLNYKCNLNCRHCCNPKNMDNYQISLNQAKKIIDEAYSLGVSEVVLTGGECTLNKDFLQISEYIKSKYLKLCIITNGIKFYDDEKLLNHIINLHPYSVQLSLYSMHSSIHDNMTQVKGSHSKTLSVIKKLKENNISVNIVNFESKYNKGSHNEIKEFAKSLNINFQDTCLFINNPHNNNYNAALSEKEMENFYTSTLDFSQKYVKFKKDNELICSAGNLRICIEPNLNITPCSYFNYILGNYNNITLKEIKTKIIPIFKKKFIRSNLSECFKKSFCDFCSYCSVHASLNRGFMKKDKILCRNAKARENAYLKYIKNEFRLK